MDKLKSLLRGVANSATLGFGDEIVGGVNALKDVITTDKTLADTPELYERYRDRYRDASKMAQAANPEAYTAGELAGGLATIALPGSAIRAPSLAKAALSGAGYGAAAGLGTSEGDISTQALDAVKGAGMGALAAPVAYGAGKAFSGLKGLFGKAPIDPRANAIGPTLQDMVDEMPSVGRSLPTSAQPKGTIGPEVEDLLARLAYAKNDPTNAAMRISEKVQPKVATQRAVNAMEREAKERAASGMVNDELTQALELTPPNVNTRTPVDISDTGDIDEITKALKSKYGGK